MASINFEIKKEIPNALGRTGVIETPHGVIETPAFVSVGTKASVKALTPEQILETGAQVVLANTYHLYRAHEMLGGTLGSIHNLYFIINLVKKMREHILSGTFPEFKKEFLAKHSS